MYLNLNLDVMVALLIGLAIGYLVGSVARRKR